MNFSKPTDAIYDNFEYLDEFTAKDLKSAEDFLIECDEFQHVPEAVLDPARGPHDFPRFWGQILGQSWCSDHSQVVALGLNTDEPDTKLMEEIKDRVAAARHNCAAKILLIKNRDNIHHACAAVRTEKMTAAWNLDRMHRYHTMLESQLYRALKELRTQQSWRLRQMAEMAPVQLALPLVSHQSPLAAPARASRVNRKTD
jgi:hypothetical protein